MRSIRFVQTLALLAACRAEPREEAASALSSGAGVLSRDAQMNALDGDSSERDASLLSEATASAADASLDSMSVAMDARSSDVGAPRSVVGVEQCRAVFPQYQRCRTVGATCNGSSVQCLHSVRNVVPPRCSGAQWFCWCAGSTTAPEWNCRRDVHMAGPLAPPELAIA